MSNGQSLICQEVKNHIDENGGFDLQWLKKHQANCNLCKNISGIISACVDEIVKPLFEELENDNG